MEWRVMNKTSKPIGVFDSGVGGLSVLRHLQRILPNEHYIYLGDTARVPYGNKSEETIREYTEQAVRFLLSLDAKLIVIACNTASAIALKQAEAMSTVPVIGMIIPAANAAIAKSINGKIGVIGTRATIGSNAYPQTLAEFQTDKKIEVTGKACPLFVPLAEEGFHFHPSAELIVKEYLAPLLEAGIDTLVLGCTHYPLLSPLIQRQLPDVTLIDCGEYAAIEAKKRLSAMNILAPKNPTGSLPYISFYLTDSTPLFPVIAERFLGFPISKPERVVLEH